MDKTTLVEMLKKIKNKLKRKKQLDVYSVYVNDAWELCIYEDNKFIDINNPMYTYSITNQHRLEYGLHGYRDVQERALNALNTYLERKLVLLQIHGSKVIDFPSNLVEYTDEVKEGKIIKFPSK